MKRAQAEGGTQQRLRRERQQEIEGSAKEWRVGRRVAWIRLTLSYLMLLKASELYEGDDGRIHAVYCSRGEDVILFTAERQKERGNSLEHDTVEEELRGFKGDQGRKGAVLDEGW